MRVKRYVVDSMPDALQKIRSDLGKEAVILNTKEIRSGGFLGLFGKRKIEVIAATDTSPKPAPPPAAQRKRETDDFRYSAPPPAAVRTSVPQEADNNSSFPPPPPAAERPYEDPLLKEIRQMKELVTRISLAGKEEEAVHPALQALKNRLIEQEVEPSLIQRLVREIAEESADGITPEKAAHAMKRKLVELLRSTGSDGCKAISPATRIAHFVGPTGVGKTTTIAKLAAEQVLKHKRKVGFITSDTYRIAAVEQLKTYATILNVPLEVVFSPQDLLKAFEKMTDRDIVFMDTAGRNFRNEMYVSELNALLSAENNGETFLVLSLTMKYKDMKAITENFMKFKLDKVLFTKMDETDSYGSIVNLLHDFPIRLSYVTTGQSVPDDIAEAKEEHIVDRILGDVAHG